MNNLFALYTAEIKKILSRKAMWVAMSIGLVFIMLVSITNLSSDGHSAYVKKEEAILRELSGRTMDNAFFDEFHHAVEQEIETNPDLYEKIMLYDPGAVYNNAADAIGRKAEYEFLYNVVRDREEIRNLTAERFYELLEEDMIHDASDLGCSSEEIASWMEVFEQVEKPMIYSYALAYENILDVLFLIGWILVLNISVALSGVFADEKTYRTDAMILSARNGRLPMCLAKMAAAITVAVLEAVVLLGTCIVGMSCIYGTTGWNAMIQIVIPISPWNITVGTMILIYIGLAMLVSVFFALTNLLVSHLTRSSVATMAVHAAVIFAGLFNIPKSMGIFAKLWELRPTMQLYYGTFCNLYRYGPFSSVGFSVLLYAVLAVGMAVGLAVSYTRSQVESR